MAQVMNPTVPAEIRQRGRMPAHRLQLASQRLLEGDGSVAKIAEDLGFSSPSHFGELFLRRFGMTPAAYRRRAREAGPPH